MKKTASMVRMRLMSADLAGSLALLMKSGLALSELSAINDLTVEFDVLRSSVSEIYSICKKHGDTVTHLGNSGAFIAIQKLIKRPVFLVGLILYIFMALMFPRYVLFVEVLGNEIVDSNLILEKARECGISFGASRKEVRSEKIKNELLHSIPQLQWVGVNTRGCVAFVSVREKIVPEETEEGVASGIVAMRDCVISSCTVWKGNALCYAGEAVTQGQSLVSGYTDLGIKIEQSGADGEIFGQTVRALRVAAPDSDAHTMQSGDPEVKYVLRIGKKLIKLYKDSGISGTSCVKMYSENKLTLPGGFALPVALIREEIQHCTVAAGAVQKRDPVWLRDYAERFLLADMIAGKILSDASRVYREENALIFEGVFFCDEIVGEKVFEEIDQHYE